jgi:hypothetical protein
MKTILCLAALAAFAAAAPQVVDDSPAFDPDDILPPGPAVFQTPTGGEPSASIPEKDEFEYYVCTPEELHMSPAGEGCWHSCECQSNCCTLLHKKMPNGEMSPFVGCGDTEDMCAGQVAGQV